jgi:peptidase A4-like protein
VGLALMAVVASTLMTAGTAVAHSSAPMTSVPVAPVPGGVLDHVVNGPLRAGSTWSAANLTNWAGYAQIDGPLPYTQVTDTFVVPTVDTAAKGTQVMSDWVGIGGVQISDRLVQAGIQMVSLKGQAYYTAWTEVYPDPERTLHMTIEPGDTVTITVAHKKKDRWLLQVTDGPTVGQRSIHVSNRVTPAASVEVIEERPCLRSPCNESDDFANLAQTSDVTFMPGSFSTTKWGKTPVETPLMASGPGDSGPNRFVMTDGEGDTLAVPSTPNAEANGFTVADGATAPSPPA